MERTDEIKPNGQAGEPHMAPDPKTAFYLIDPATKQKHLVRDMTAAQLEAFRAGVSHMSQGKMKSVLARLQLLLNPLECNLCLQLFEQAVTTAALLMVLEFEQNRRLNLPAETVA